MPSLQHIHIQRHMLLTENSFSKTTTIQPGGPLQKMETKSTILTLLTVLVLTGCATTTSAPQVAQNDMYELTYNEERLSYTVTTTTPTPCYETNHTTQVDNNILIIDITHTANEEDVCIQVIDQRTIEGTLNTTLPERIHILENNEETLREQIQWQPQLD